jgi:tetratricopeptide (TPR) repeat protein
LATPLTHPAEALIQLINASDMVNSTWIDDAAAAYRSSQDNAWLLPWALALWRVGRFDEVVEVTDLATRPLSTNVDLLVLRASAARQSGHDFEAIQQIYLACLKINPLRADVHFNYGNLLLDATPSLAVAHYKTSLHLDCGNASAWHNLGIGLSRVDDHVSAIAAFQVAISLNPVNADAYCNLGLSLQALNCLGPASHAFKVGISLDQGHSPSHINLGNVLVASLRPDEAIQYLHKGITLDPGSTKSLFNLSLAYLVLGNYQEGWRLYESRFSTESFVDVHPPSIGSSPVTLDQCPSVGEAPLIVWSEQGMGDAIQFVRYLHLLDAARIPFIFESRKPLLALFRDWFGLGERVILRRSDTNMGDTRQHIALMSLPNLFQTTVETIPSVTPYLFPPSQPPDHLRINPPAGGLAVGLAWATNPDNAQMYRHKSVAVELLMPPLLQLVDLGLIQLHSLQVGSDAQQLLPWRDVSVISDWSTHLTDFSDTAYVINQLDLVISVDTAVAHLAGALGVPVFLLLPHNADYRWLRSRNDTPWYPKMRLFRQEQPSDWQGVINKLRVALDELFLLNLSSLANSSI